MTRSQQWNPALLLTLLVTTTGLCAVLIFASLGQVAQAQPIIKTLTRQYDPITITGAFVNVPNSQVFVYRLRNGGWQQIPFQIDEVSALGNYTSGNDGQIDSNDELVFMSNQVGDKAGIDIATVLPIRSRWYEVELTEPFSPTLKGWVYIVRSAVLTPTNQTDEVTFDPALRRITGHTYSIGWSNSFGGFDYTSIMTSGNILDRSKTRITAPPFGTFSENSSLLSPNTMTLIKDGPVRVITQQQGSNATKNVNLGYPNSLVIHSNIDLIHGPNVPITSVRFSTDLTNTITNGTYYNENVSQGVTIDGITDTVTSTLVRSWRQISLDQGSLIQVVALTGATGLQRHYYLDNRTRDPSDTGDQRSYGDSGLEVVFPTGTLFTITNTQYFLPNRQPNRGYEFYNYASDPLTVTIQLKGKFSFYLPTIIQ